MPKDACYRKVMRSYGKWSARAAQATAKCRKAKGDVRKGEAGANLKRWTDEKWVDTRTGKPCGPPRLWAKCPSLNWPLRSVKR